MLEMTQNTMTSVLPRYFRPGGPPGLIHWKIIAAWLKTEDLTQRKISKWEYLSISKKESQ